MSREHKSDRSRLKRALMASLAVGALVAAGAAHGEDARRLSVPAGSLEAALTALAAQTGSQLLYGPELVAGRRAAALDGRFTPDEALARLLAGSGISAAHVAPRVIVLKPRAAVRPSPAGGQAATSPFDAEAPGSGSRAADRTPADAAPMTATAEPAPPIPAILDEVRITGTHIRGGSPAAPVLVLDRRALETSGYATVAEALQAIPQNFGGQGTEATVGVHADTLHTNSGYATGVNLRGLGSDSTLVLVNGRRLAGSGFKGDFADVSGIPAMAVERVEVLLDGASALYGSDAVGGVVNFILRKDLEGGEIHVRAGAGDDGPHEQLVGAAVGHAWGRGSVIVAYEGYHRDALPASARDFTASSDLRPLGGADHRDTFSYPGNILRTDPATGLAAPYWAIPAGQSGVGLKPGDFQAGVVNLYNQNVGLDVLPDQRRQSVYLALRQEVTPRVSLSGDARYSFREVRAHTSGLTSTLTVRPGNPFFVSPNGAASNQIRYAFSGEGGVPLTHVGVGSLTASLGAEVRLPGDWRASGYGAFAQELIQNNQSGILQTTVLAEALGNSADNPGTAFQATRDGFLNPYAAVPGANSAGTLAAITSGFASSRYKSQVRSANLEADGTVAELPGGPLKLAFGGQVREETFRDTGSSYTSGAAPAATRPIHADRTVSALFAEAQLPIVGAGNRLPGIEALSVSAAVRAERYSDFGNTVNPRFSVQWTPVDGVRVRGTYGQSFRAPSLVDINSALLNSYIFATVNGAQVLTFARQGGNPDLGPETARTWTLGADFDPRGIPGLHLSLDGFQTTFRDRIAAPLFGVPRTAILTDPRLAPFVQRISPTTNAQDLALITQLIADPATTTQFGTFPPSEIVAIIDQRQVNTAGLTVRGVDLMGSYQHAAFGGQVSYAANASWMLDYKQALTPATPFVDLVGQPGFPARFRGRATVDWVRGPLDLGLAVNRLGGQKDSLGVKIDPQTTLDLAVRIMARDGSRWAGTKLSLSIRNVFDKAPPFYDNSLGFGYDPTTGDVIGRFISLDLTHSW